MKSYTYMKHKILYLFVAAAMLAACQDDLDNETFTISDEVPAATWLSTNDSTKMWTELLRYTDLYNTINLDGTYTLFVPTDSAMQNYLDSKGLVSIEDFVNNDSLYAVRLVKYATIADRSYTSLNFNNNVLPDTTATGDRLTVTFDDSGNYWINNDEARIERFDIEVTNGEIFLIDAVLEPITETLDDYIVSNPGEYSIFKELLDVTGVAYAKSAGRSAYTLFLVPNDKFEQAGIHNMNELAAHLGASTTDPSKWKNGEDPMYRFAAYHFLSTIRSTKDLATSTSLIVESMADAAYLEFLEESGVAYINGDVQIEEGNIACKNGIIHIVDGLLEIEMPSQLPTVKFDLTDNACLREDPNYAVPTLQEQYTRWLDISDTTALGYKWDPLTSSVGFEVAASSDSVRMQFVNYDALVLNLGQYEDIEIATPTIIADSTTYDITLSHYNPFADEYGNRITIYVDDEMIGTITTSGESVEDNLYVEAEVGSVTFPETSKHIVRILDNTGATIELDQIVFTPKAKK